MGCDKLQSADEQRQHAWLIRVADKIEAAEKHFPRELVPAENRPLWVIKVESLVEVVLLPVAKVKEIHDESDITPKRFGALVGHMCAMAVWTMEWMEYEGNRTHVDLGKLSDAEFEQALKVQRAFDEWYSAMRRVAKCALCSSVDQKYADMADFLLGYANAFATKPKTFRVGDMGGTTFEIYLFMMMFWRVVERLGSVPRLHQVLGKAFSPFRVGTLKRVEKICERIDLHYRKPGRPRLKQ